MEAQVSRLEFRDAMARVCAPVNIVTTDGPAGRGGFTATAMSPSGCRRRSTSSTCST